MKKRNTWQTISGLLNLMSAGLKLRMCVAVFFGFLAQVMYLITLGLPILYLSQILFPRSNIPGEYVPPLSNLYLHLPVWGLMLVIIGLGILRGFVKFGEQYMNHYIAFTLLAQIRNKVYGALERLAPSKLEEKKQGDIISLITADTETIEVFYAHTISPFFIAITSGLFVLLILGFFASWWIALFFLCSYLIIGFIVPFIHYSLEKKEGKAYRTSFNEMNANYLDFINGSKEIRYLNKEEKVMETINQESEELHQKEIRLKTRSTILSSVTNLLIFVLSLGIIFGSIALVKQPESALFGSLLAVSSFAPAIALASLPSFLSQSFTSGDRILDLMEEKTMVEDVKKEGQAPVLKDVTLKNISFHYLKEKDLLKNVSYSFPSSGIVVIKGYSGAGKSTLLKLIFRHLLPNSGEILLSGINVNEIDSTYLREKVAMMNQSTYLFNETIRDNMREAKVDASEGEIYSALAKAHMDSFVKGLPQGLDTVINSDSSNISTGQKQRLGLARIFLRNPTILLLDEPTSNVDWLNENIIFHSLIDYSKDHLILLVTHHDVSTAFANQILELKNQELLVK